MLRKRLSFGVLYKLRPSFASVLHRSSPGPAVCASLSFCVHEDLRVSCFPLLVADAYIMQGGQGRQEVLSRNLFVQPSKIRGDLVLSFDCPMFLFF